MAEMSLNTSRREFGPILRASPSSIPVGQTKGRPFYGQVKGQHCPTWQSYAGLPPGEGACVTGLSSCCIRHAKHGGSENRTTGPAARWKCTPIPLRGLPPKGGSLLSAFLSANLSQSLYSAARISPSGEDAAAGGRRGAFPTPVRAVCLFSPRPSGRLYGFIHTGAQLFLKAPTTAFAP